MNNTSNPRSLNVSTNRVIFDSCSQKLSISIEAPSIVNTAPVTSPIVLFFTRLANFAERSEDTVATAMQTSIMSHFSSTIAGWIRMWLVEAIRAVNVIMNVLVPTAVLSSIPKKAVKIISIIMPPPVPTKPVPKPTGIPHSIDMITSLSPSFSPFLTGFLRLVSGFTRKRIPMQKVRNNVKLPSTTFPARKAT